MSGKVARWASRGAVTQIGQKESYVELDSLIAQVPSSLDFGFFIPMVRLQEQPRPFYYWWAWQISSILRCGKSWTTLPSYLHLHNTYQLMLLMLTCLRWNEAIGQYAFATQNDSLIASKTFTNHVFLTILLKDTVVKGHVYGQCLVIVHFSQSFNSNWHHLLLSPPPRLLIQG